MNLEQVITEVKTLFNTIKTTPEIKGVLNEFKYVIDNLLKDNKEKLNAKLIEWTSANEILKTTKDISSYREKQIRINKFIRLLFNIATITAYLAPEYYEKKIKKQQETENKKN